MGTGVARSKREATAVESEGPSLRSESHDRRTNTHSAEDVTPVRLTRKYADVLNGVDLSGHDVGDRLPLPPRDAGLLIAEGWASPASTEERRRSDLIQRETASDRRR